MKSALFLAMTVVFAGQLARAADDADTLGPLVQLLAESDDAQFQLDILKGMSEALKGRAGIAMPQNWPTAAEKLSKSSSPEVRAMAQSLSSFFGDPATMEKLKKIVKDKSATPDLRKKSLGDLIEAKQKDLAPLLQELQDKTIPPKDITPATVRQLSELKDERIDKWIATSWGSVKTTPEDKLKEMARIREIVNSAKPESVSASRGRAMFMKTCAQ